jgi:glycopeptide antibiotics resistance protein
MIHTKRLSYRYVNKEAREIKELETKELRKNIFRSKPYKTLSRILVIIYCLFMVIYMFRENLFEMNDRYIDLLAGTAPNLVPSFLFTLIGIFYVVPFLKGVDAINKPMFIWIINALNLTIFLLLEYFHVLFSLGSWDNNDIIASLIGIIASTIIYYNLRKSFVKGPEGKISSRDLPGTQ